MSESAFTAVGGTGRNGAGLGAAAANTTRTANAVSALRRMSGSPSQGGDQVDVRAGPLDGDAHVLPGLAGAQRERVVVDVVHADAVEAHDDIVGGESGPLG